MTTIGGTPNSNISSYNDPCDKIMDRQPASTSEKMTIKDSHYPQKMTLMMQTQLTNSKILKEPDKL